MYESQSEAGALRLTVLEGQIGVRVAEFDENFACNLPIDSYQLKT
jgi:hypothetical protein